MLKSPCAKNTVLKGLHAKMSMVMKCPDVKLSAGQKLPMPKCRCNEMSQAKEISHQTNSLIQTEAGAMAFE